MLTKTESLVTVIVVCYNHAPYIRECLDSIENQHYNNIQLIIVDDCSEDNSVSIITDWLRATRMDSIFLVHAQNRGICSALNDGLRHAKGNFVSFISADDRMVHAKLQKQVSMLSNMPLDVGAMYSHVIPINEQGKCYKKNVHSIAVSRPPQNLFLFFATGGVLQHSTFLYRRAALHRVGRFDERLVHEDLDYFLRFSRAYKIGFCPIATIEKRGGMKTALHVRLGTDLKIQCLESDLLVFEKVIGVNAEADTYLIARYKSCTDILYELQHKNKIHFYFKRAYYSRDIYSFILFCAVFLGIPPAVLQFLLKYAGKCKYFPRRMLFMHRETVHR